MSQHDPVSGSEYQTSSTDQEAHTASPSASWSPSPRKRKHSQSEVAGSTPHPKRHLQRQYNDAYRNLFNKEVERAATHFVLDVSFAPPQDQTGASQWSSEEKLILFAALERLGRDNIAGIARAIGSKSIPEVHEFILLLQDAALKQGGTKTTLRDIPAAVELSAACTKQLELAGDALAFYQERFEAKEEQERYGKYWLITPDIANEVEEAMRPSRTASPSCSRPPKFEGEGAKQSSKSRDRHRAQILEDIPEGELLKLSVLLKLSSTIFMNSSPALDFPFPHWSTLVSPLASEPSVYRTALMDFHTLTVSVTKRLIQAAIIQATSRIRSQGWRVQKNVKPFVRRRDVLTAISIVKMPRNGLERWRGVARRCGLLVSDGTGKSKKELDWDEVEEYLRVSDHFVESSETGVNNHGLLSGSEDATFGARATRSSTPLPSGLRFPSVFEPESDSDREHSDQERNPDDSDGDSSQSSLQDSPVPDMKPWQDSSAKPMNLEEFDHEASLAEEQRLWYLLGHPVDQTVPALDDKYESSLSDERLHPMDDDWRGWTEYRAEWEEFYNPAPLANFQANQKSNRSSMPFRPGYSSDTNIRATSLSSNEGRRRKKRMRTAETELPIRGARAYAALRERTSAPDGLGEGTDNENEDTKLPVASVENPYEEGAVSDMDEDIESVLHSGGPFD
ncbi:hypothetical protein CC78DRAFT_167960 [Lojkania enalia]|uniref:Myb-like domain-containing protein n=1 Tax=Lojkania enalia TaxID=147567 RepID=A0A9P4KCY5_9PLEO|nr:hypothetical protein CC78DRAFT_167960 [Didymosphaeria enalia]